MNNKRRQQADKNKLRVNLSTTSRFSLPQRAMFKPRLHADRSFKEGGRYLIIQYQYISNIFIGIAAGEGRGHSPLALLPWAATGGKGFFVCMGKRLMNFLVGRVLPFVAEAGVNFLWGNRVLLGVGFWRGGELWAGSG